MASVKSSIKDEANFEPSAAREMGKRPESLWRKLLGRHDSEGLKAEKGKSRDIRERQRHGPE